MAHESTRTAAWSSKRQAHFYGKTVFGSMACKRICRCLCGQSLLDGSNDKVWNIICLPLYECILYTCLYPQHVSFRRNIYLGKSYRTATNYCRNYYNGKAMTNIDISIVVPLYRCETAIKELTTRICNTLEAQSLSLSHRYWAKCRNCQLWHISQKRYSCHFIHEG